MTKKKQPSVSLETSEISRLFGIKGSYTVLMFLAMETRIDVGSLGLQTFPKGFYTYPGSAFGKGSSSLDGRIQRHLREDKKKRWHIDYLLAADNVVIQAVVAAHTNRKKECEINRHLRRSMGAKTPIKGFGSSDCRAGCGSHLLFLGPSENLKSITKVYSEKTDGKIYVLRFH